MTMNNNIAMCCWGNLYPTLSLLTKEMQSFQKFNTKQFTSYTINSCTNRLICMRFYNTWIKILQIDNYLKNEKYNYLLISGSQSCVQHVKISKNAKKVYQTLWSVISWTNCFTCSFKLTNIVHKMLQFSASQFRIKSENAKFHIYFPFFSLKTMLCIVTSNH